MEPNNNDSQYAGSSSNMENDAINPLPQQQIQIHPLEHQIGPPPAYSQDSEEIVQVIYQSNPDGAYVGIQSQLIDPSRALEASALAPGQFGAGALCCEADATLQEQILVASQQQPLLPPTGSILPSVVEESTGSGGTALAYETSYSAEDHFTESTNSYGGTDQTDENAFKPAWQSRVDEDSQETTVVSRAIDQNENSSASNFRTQDQSAVNEPPGQVSDPNAIYSTINRQNRNQQQSQPSTIDDSTNFVNQTEGDYYDNSNLYAETDQILSSEANGNEVDQNETTKENNLEDVEEDVNAEIRQLLSRNKPGAVESGSFRRDFRKKLGMSMSSNENELIVHRQKFLEAQAGNIDSGSGDIVQSGDNQSKFKRTHSVSFNVAGSRAGRLSVDLRNLPSYLTHKRASIVDVAKGAMSSLFHGLAGGAGSGSAPNSSKRRDSSPEEELIFEEPIAPTLSLGQRVALIRDSGTEFGTVGWIGQLPDFDDDWIVGVIFDNMIGDCDGEYKGTRYFYSRENYAMFVPLSALTKTDNYIGRPETGTMLSRMSVSLKPGQLISIQRSSIRLQHCFLNAPHQRVGHDVRAVSNRLHCQCHNCGPCAHLTKKQGRTGGIPHHLQPYSRQHYHAPAKKNSLAHAAVELLAHHHHHYHDEEEHEQEEEQYHFGDNAAHACNFVRYSCCRQTGSGGHNFSADCEMVRPELLDNLIHAPRAPHRRPRLRRRRANPDKQAVEKTQNLAVDVATREYDAKPVTEMTINQETSTLSTNATNNDEEILQQMGTMKSYGPSELTETTTTNYGTQSRSCSSCDDGDESSRSGSITDHEYEGQDGSNSNYNYRTPGAFHKTCSYQYASESYLHGGNSVYNTVDSKISIMDQRRYIHQRDSSAFLRSRVSATFSDEYDSNYDGSVYSSGVSFGSRLKRCFPCIFKHTRGIESSSRRRPRRPKKRKLSARDRLIEYRRRQSTFVPSTLAKPREDFASHGIIVESMAASAYLDNEQVASNSDYSSYSNESSGHSSICNSPRHENNSSGIQGLRQSIGTEEFQNHGQQLKSSQYHSFDQPYTNVFRDGKNENSYSDDTGSYKKIGHSQESALTDLGFNDITTISSNDTLKRIVDKSVNEEVAQPEQLSIDQYDELLSPVVSSTRSSPSEQIQVSSPTASILDQEEAEIGQRIHQLELNGPPDGNEEGENSSEES